MNYESLARELVRSLRGQRSQEATNRRLRRTSNVLHAWERGTRSPAASDFFGLAALARVDVRGALETFDASARRVEKPEPFAATAWVKSIVSALPVAELARRIERDRNTVARWRTGVTEPRLPDLLRIVDVTTLRLLDFVAAFTKPETLPSIRSAARDLNEQRELAYTMPWTHAVLRALELEGYRRSPHHFPGFIAREAGLTRELEEQCIEALARTGQIRRRRGKWVVARVMTVDTRDDPERNLALKKHWAAVSVDRLRRGALERGGLFSYNLFSISDTGFEELRRAHLEYFERIRSIVGSSSAPTRLVLANLQLVPLGAQTRA